MERAASTRELNRSRNTISGPATDSPSEGAASTRIAWAVAAFTKVSKPNIAKTDLIIRTTVVASDARFPQGDLPFVLTRREQTRHREGAGLTFESGANSGNDQSGERACTGSGDGCDPPFVVAFEQAFDWTTGNLVVAVYHREA